ncbi:MAG: IPTL-CTERM sorting domain-containing protein [Candidatus Dadabacteria bacterium]|nr:MAG: IPTL-CTERM sorting domain-containing protein [Candidatus Dadabacteria bacterium]
MLFAVGLYFPANAQPPLWQNDFGDELTDLTGEDDEVEAIALPFPFPFNGSTFDMAYVGTDGCMQLGGLGLDGNIDHDLWIYMDAFLSDSDPDNPLICPFNIDLDLSTIGTIYYNNARSPLIITWDGVGTNENEVIPSTFQILLYQDGRIVHNYNGMIVGGDFLTDLDDGIVTGVTPSDLPFFPGDPPTIPSDPGPVDLNQGPFDFGPTVYERWCFNVADSCGVGGDDTGLPGPINTAFDLDFWSICFTPNEDGFSINSGFQGQVGNCDEFVFPTIPTLSEWGLIAMAGILGLVGFMVLRRRKITA